MKSWKRFQLTVYIILLFWGIFNEILKKIGKFYLLLKFPFGICVKYPKEISDDNKKPGRLQTSRPEAESDKGQFILGANN